MDDGQVASPPHLDTARRLEGTHIGMIARSAACPGERSCPPRGSSEHSLETVRATLLHQAGGLPPAAVLAMVSLSNEMRHGWDCGAGPFVISSAMISGRSRVECAPCGIEPAQPRRLTESVSIGLPFVWVKGQAGKKRCIRRGFGWLAVFS